jgi:hypothetical protein
MEAHTHLNAGDCSLRSFAFGRFALDFQSHCLSLVECRNGKRENKAGKMEIPDARFLAIYRINVRENTGRGRASSATEGEGEEI